VGGAVLLTKAEATRLKCM